MAPIHVPQKLRICAAILYFLNALAQCSADSLVQCSADNLIKNGSFEKPIVREGSYQDFSRGDGIPEVFEDSSSASTIR